MSAKPSPEDSAIRDEAQAAADRKAAALARLMERLDCVPDEPPPRLLPFRRVNGAAE